MCAVNFNFNIEHAYPYVYEAIEIMGENACEVQCVSSTRPATEQELLCSWHFCATASLLQPRKRKTGESLWNS
ncbi:unnamed protein product, partial [Ascophyllum nodosum]